MKATGIVRRIDDLGRVVIPKEIRRTMRIREGEPLEIYTESGGSVIFKKYSPAGELGKTASQLCEAVSKTCGHQCLICDRDAVIAASGGVRRDLENKPISPELETALNSRQTSRPEGKTPVSTATHEHSASVVMPIIAGGDLSGGFVFITGEAPIGDVEMRIGQMAALFFARQMED